MQSGCPHGAEPAGRHRSATPAHAPKIGGAGPTPLGGPSRRTATAARARSLSIGIARSRMEKERPALMVKGVCVARYRAAMGDLRFVPTVNDAPPNTLVVLLDENPPTLLSLRKSSELRCCCCAALALAPISSSLVRSLVICTSSEVSLVHSTTRMFCLLLDANPLKIRTLR